ncbi:MAG: hypothetical protein ACLFRP_00365 [Puniceicoccaceae bacterium]
MSTTTGTGNLRFLPTHVLEPLCAPFAKDADRILDLYEMTKTPQRQPGRCVSCFYDLFQKAPSAKRKALTPLREWIEENLEIEIRSEPDGSELQALALRLDSPDLETFCLDAMETARERNRAEATRLQLEIRFKPAAA